MKTIASLHHNKYLLMRPYKLRHIVLPSYFYITVVLWMLFGLVILLLFPVFIFARLYKLVKHSLSRRYS
jgi:hypothetical protein